MAAKRIRNGVYEYVFRHRLLGDQPVVRRFHRAEDGDRFASEMERALKRGFVPAALLEDQEPLRSRRLPVETLRALMISYRYNCSIKPEDHYLLTLLEERLPKDLGIDQIDYDWAESFVRSLKLDYNPAPGTIRKYVGAVHCPTWPSRQSFASQSYRDSEVHPALMGSDVRDVGDPVRVRRGHVELPVQQVRRDRGRLAAVMPRTAPIAHLGAQTLDPHQPINAMPAVTLAQITKVAGH